MIMKSLFIALLFITSGPVFADTLVVGSVYFDSAQTLNEVIRLSAQHDNEGIAKLIENGHVSNQTATDIDIVVLTTGSTPQSPAEFRFLNGPTTYWTLTKNVTNFSNSISSSSSVSGPTPEPSPTPVPQQSSAPAAQTSPPSAPKPTPAESPASTSKPHERHHESDAPFDDDNGQRIWHRVNGKWKWYPANKHHAPVKKALPPDNTQPANP
jgi:hypothetical protein